MSSNGTIILDIRKVLEQLGIDAESPEWRQKENTPEQRAQHQEEAVISWPFRL